jgi:serine/threonine protein kinase
MAAPTTTVELAELVRNSGLFDPAKVDAHLPADAPLPDSPSALLDQLVRDGVCTKYQAKMILAGRVKRLVLGKYRLLRPIGRGGMGNVYLGEHTAHRRRVAVKVLRGEPARDPLAAARFEREARAAAALDHPNLVRLFDSGMSHGVPYLVMEYVPGVTVQHLLDKAGPLSVAQAVHIVSQAAEGLAHAHARGIIHRDVKPLNLMFTDGGRVKLLDMGLALAIDRREDRLTEQAGDPAICGTVDFLSPEQCGHGRLDQRSDVYSLGVTLYTLLTGRPPFAGSAGEKIAAHLNCPPPSPKAVAPAVPDGLNRVVERMTAKRPDHRPPTCEAVVRELAPWCPATAPDPPTLDPMRTTNIRIGPSGQTVEPAATPLIRRRYLALAVVALLLGVAVGVFFWRPVVTATDPVTHGPWAGECLLLRGNESPVNDLVFTPDGRHLVGVDWDGRVQVWNADSGQHLHSTRLKGDTSALACSVGASGRVYASGHELGVSIIDPASGRVVRQFDTPHPRLWTVRPSADERRLLLAGEEAVEVWDLESATRLTSYPTSGEYIWVAAFSPDESMIAAGGRIGDEFEGPGVIHLWDTATATERLTLTGHTMPVRSIAFSPDGRTLYSGGFDGTVRVWDTTTGECLRVIDAHAGYVERVVPVSGGLLLTVAAPPKKGSGLQRLVKLWAADGQEVSGGPPEDDRHLYAAAVSPDRTRFAASANSHTVRLWTFRPPPD